MTPFDALKAQLSAVVPFAAYVGVEITEIGEGTATTISPFGPSSSCRASMVFN